VPLTLLNALANSSLDSIELLLFEFNSIEKGVYLPPKNLKNIESSLIFIPKTSQTPMPAEEEFDDQLYSQPKDSLFLTPPGKELSQLIEKEGATSFIKIDLQTLEQKLPNILVRDMELAEDVEIISEQNNVTITIAGNALSEVCEQTNGCPHVHAQVGCILTSALACAFAKTSGKPIIIENEIVDQETKTTTIKFKIIDNESTSFKLKDDNTTSVQETIQEETPQTKTAIPSTGPKEATELTVTTQVDLNQPIQTPAKATLSEAAAKSSSEITTAQKPELKEITSVNQIPSAPVRNQVLKPVQKLEEKQSTIDLEELKKTINEQEQKMKNDLANIRQEIEKLTNQITEDKSTSKSPTEKEKSKKETKT
jgi:hypothetical protein